MNTPMRRESPLSAIVSAGMTAMTLSVNGNSTLYEQTGESPVTYTPWGAVNELSPREALPREGMFVASVETFITIDEINPTWAFAGRKVIQGGRKCFYMKREEMYEALKQHRDKG